MKRIFATLTLVAAVGAVEAQEPTRPARPARPAPAERPMVTPRAAIAPLPPLSELDIEEIRSRALDASRLSDIDRDMIRENARIATEAARETMEANRESIRAAAEAAREMSRIDMDEMREHARRAAEEARYFTPLAVPAIDPMPALAPMRAIEPMIASAVTSAASIASNVTSAIAPMALYGPHEFRVHPPQFIQGDPADSLYKLAHDLLARGEYGRSAQLFKDIAQKYPKSAYQDDLPYYEAWARYKIGTTDELRNASKLLEPRASKLIGVVNASNSSNMQYYGFNGRRRTSDGDVVGLYLRVNSALAQRGDRAAADIVSKAAQSGSNVCDPDERQIRIEAMGALSNMDPAQALPIIRNVLNKKDECNVEVRKRAIFILGRRGDAEAANLIGAAAKSDPSSSVRAEAITWLPKLQGDAGVNQLEEILRTEQDQDIQRSVVRTLTSSDNAKARSSMRALIDRKDAPINLRIEAVNSFNSERATNDDAAYLRNLYTRADDDRLKNAIISAIARIGGPENDQWVLNLAKNQNEPSQFRATAISRLMRSNMPVSDLIKLYDASESYDIRNRIVSALENRKETEAADKLYDIVKTSTVRDIKLQAFNALMRRKDPRSTQLLNDILEGKKP
jgi:HEAT repeat protein/TolA-binding protein